MTTAMGLLLFAESPDVRADDDPVQELRFATVVLASVNPFTVVGPVALRYQHRLYATSSPILRHNFVEVSTALVLGPLFAPRVRLAVHPTAFFEVGAGYGVTDIFIKTIEERRSPASPYDVNIIEFDAGDTATLHSFTVDTTLQAAVGKLLFRSVNSLTYTAASLAAGETVYYSAPADMLLPAHGWLLSDDTALAYMVSPTVRIGITETLFATAYPASAYAPGQVHDAAANSPSVRVGPSFNLTLRDQPHGPLAHIELFGGVQWYVVDRYRTGAAIDGAIPFCILGARSSGSLWKR